MKTVDGSDCVVHVNICTNDRPAPKTGCGTFGGQDFYLSIKQKLKETGLSATHWVTRTGCLGFCNPVGCTVTIHRAGQSARWFNEVTKEDFDRIWGEIVRE